jgi:ammonia channel protein AmtB
MYRKLSERTFAPTNLTKVVTGTLIILITGLFINGGAGGQLTSESDDEMKTSPNAIVMNTVISSATSGLTLMLMTQYNNVKHAD